MSNKNAGSVALVGSYVPRRCGIATFTHDLATALCERVYRRPLGDADDLIIVALDDREGEYAYGKEVRFKVRQHRKEDYISAAEFLNFSGVGAVSLQHEYGLFGGTAGAYVLELIRNLKVPVVSTLHTVLSEPASPQREVLREVCDASAAVVVMAERARHLLADVYGVGGEKVQLIHHGVPDVEPADRDRLKERFDVAGRPTILTFGLLSPNKGIELMLEALARVAPNFPNLAYIVLGATHPGVRQASGESYRLGLETRARDLGIAGNVIFHNRYVSRQELCEFLQAADLYVTPYRCKDQIVSGTLAYALAAGKAIISTPYDYAREVLADGRGRLVDFGDVDGLADSLQELLSDADLRNDMGRRAYRFGRAMIWPSVARAYDQAFRQVRRAFVERRYAAAVAERPRLQFTLPEMRLDHLFALSDDTGILQHASHATPDRHHGYCTDDNARALIVAAMAWRLFKNEKVLNYFQTYLSFVHHAQTSETGKFCNMMSYDRRWTETEGSEDCQGRALWGLGYVVAHPPDGAALALSKHLFDRALPNMRRLSWPRAWAFAVLGCYYYLRRFGEASEQRALMALLSGRLNELFARNQTDEWPWFEDMVTYDNARCPQALILAAKKLRDEAMLRRGLRVLDWLLDIQTAPEGYLSVIGNDGWLPKGGQKARFDQQPLEAAALIGACKAAYGATDERRWLDRMRRCFEWYLGRNDCGVPLVDFNTRGCADGLGPRGINPNQGAESTISWLLSLLIMHETHGTDPVTARLSVDEAVAPLSDPRQPDSDAPGLARAEAAG